MECFVYKGQKKLGTYLFVEYEANFSRVPTSLLELLGSVELVTTIELTENTVLAQACPKNVIQELKEFGFYLQLPSADIKLKSVYQKG